jgi:hypothetical protein
MDNHDVVVNRSTPPVRQPSPGLKLLQRSASEVALEDSIEAEGKFMHEAESLAVEHGMVSPGRALINSPDERDLSTASASSTHTAASVQAALASSQQLGGQPVAVSLNAKTPQKVATPDDKRNIRGSGSSSGHHSHSKLKTGTSPRSPATPKSLGSKPTTPTSTASALSTTAPTPIRSHEINGGTGAERGTSLHSTSPHPGHHKGVTINEKENTLHSPHSKTIGNHSNSPVPTLKPAGKNSDALDDDVNALVQRARQQASPRSTEDATSNIAIEKQSARVVHDPDADLAKARARASYLLKQASNAAGSNTGRESNGDGYSEVSTGSRSSLRSSKSAISDALRKSQENGWGDKVTASLGDNNNGLTAAQQALFLSMKKVSSTTGTSRRGPRSSGEYKRGSEACYSDDGDRPSTAGSIRSSASDRSRSSKSISKSTKKSAKEKTEILNKLTAPVRHIYTADDKKNDPTLKFMLLEEAKECSKKPFKSKRWAESTAQPNDDDDEAKGSGGKSGSVPSFVARMDGQERNRRHEMQFTIAKKAYDARLDRKECPQCHSKQSYDEVVNKRNKCSVCEIEFKPKLTWAKVSKQFNNRNKEYAIKSKELHAKIIKQVENEKKPKHHAFNPKTGKVEEIVAEPKSTRWDDNMEKSFFDRMEEKLELRDDRLEQVEAESFGVQCTFKPHIAKKKTNVGSDDDEEQEELTEEDKAQAFMMRYDADLEERKKSHPEKYKIKHHYVDPKISGKSHWN